MKPFAIDFAVETGAWRWDWRMPGTRLFVLLALVSGVLGGAAWLRAQQLQQREQAIAAQLARIDESRRSAARQVRTRSEDDALLRQWQQRRALPWEAIFQAFENAAPVHMDSFEPDVTRGVVKVQASADDIAQVQDYLGALQASPVFMRVSLLRHELPPDGKGVSFHFEAVLAAPYRLASGSTP